MSIQDPFFVVRDEVQTALMLARSLYARWRDIEDKPCLVSQEERDYTNNELRNSLRSIDWDLEDLEETVSIVEKNPKKFKIDERELNERRNFILRTRAAVQDLRRQMQGAITNQVNGAHDNNTAQEVASTNGLGLAIRPNHFGQLADSTEPQQEEQDSPQQQQALIEPEEICEDRSGAGSGMSRSLISHQSSNDLDDQNALLDELGHEVEQPETRVRRALKRITSVLSLDRRQWFAIVLLLVAIVILLIVFFTL